MLKNGEVLFERPKDLNKYKYFNIFVIHQNKFKGTGLG